MELTLMSMTIPFFILLCQCHQGYKDFGIHHMIIMMFPDCNIIVVNRHNCVYILFLKRLCGGNRCK